MSTVVDVEITSEDIRMAKTGAAWAIELVIGSMDSRIRSLAAREARGMLTAGPDFWTEEFRQVAMVAMWSALPRFEGDEVDAFRAYMYKTAELEIRSEATKQRHQGADEDSVKTFAYWLAKCDGDLDLAEQMCQRFPDKYGRKLGRDRANAARMAQLLPHSIEGSAITGGNPVSHGSEDDANEAASYADLLVSTLGIPDEFITSDDLSRLESTARQELVHAVLGAMGDGAASVLKYTFGIDGYGAYGVDANDEIGAMVGKTAKQVIDARTKGYKAFAQRFIKLITANIADPELMVQEQDDWWEAFRAERERSNARGNKL